MTSVGGGLRLFRLFGIDVYLHWTWAVVAFFFIRILSADFEHPDDPANSNAMLWATATYLSLFAIVLIHEFGHAMACKSVGGTADTIMLWPLGGIAFVNPPLRPGAVLWSIAAGPLVNVILFPVTWYLSAWFPAPQAGVPGAGDLGLFLYVLWEINTLLLVFNLMPIYPLDGGQILHALLWFVLGFARALLIVSVIGLLGAGGLFVLAAMHGKLFSIVMAIFIASQAWRGFVMARALRRLPDPAQPLEQQIQEAATAVDVPAPQESPPPLPEEPAPTMDETTQRIVSESYEEALRRERVAATHNRGDNFQPPRSES